MIFSILIPVYNTEKYLQGCVQSVLQQTEQDFEIILANDCSTDGSGLLCDELSEQYSSKIRVIHNDKNYGLLMTRRKLFAAANGEWVLCVDSDDLLENTALEKLKAVIESESPDIVLFNLKCFHMDGSTEEFRPDLRSNHLFSENEKTEILRCFYKNNDLNSMCTKAVKASILDLEDDYHDCPVKIGEDAFQTYPLFDRAKRIFYLDEFLYRYRKNEGGMTVSLKYDYYDMFKPLWERDRFYREKWDLSYDAYKQSDTNRIKKTVQYLRQGAQQHGYGWLKQKIDEIRTDGTFEEAFHMCKIGGRYQKYCNAIISGKYFRFYVLGNMETVLLFLKK